MADKYVRRGASDGTDLLDRYHENDDGSHSQQVALSERAPDSLAATIANGESLSDAIDLAGRYPVALIMPAEWTDADLTFQVSQDDSTYLDLYTSGGTEVLVAAEASRCIALSAATMLGFSYLKVRSGAAAAPVAQGAERVVSIVVRPY